MKQTSSFALMTVASMQIISLDLRFRKFKMWFLSSQQVPIKHIMLPERVPFNRVIDFSYDCFLCSTLSVTVWITKPLFEI
jgi:hypothetical protein